MHIYQYGAILSCAVVIIAAGTLLALAGVPTWAATIACFIVTFVVVRWVVNWSKS
jgi:hypothetical protein